MPVMEYELYMECRIIISIQETDIPSRILEQNSIFKTEAIIEIVLRIR